MNCLSLGGITFVYASNIYVVGKTSLKVLKFLLFFFCFLMAFLVLLSFERLIKETAAYCAQRKAFGKSILDNQYVHFRLAELQTEVELLRSIIYRTTGGYPVSAHSHSHSG